MVFGRAPQCALRISDQPEWLINSSYRSGDVLDQGSLCMPLWSQKSVRACARAYSLHTRIPWSSLNGITLFNTVVSRGFTVIVWIRLIQKLSFPLSATLLLSVSLVSPKYLFPRGFPLLSISLATRRLSAISLVAVAWAKDSLLQVFEHGGIPVNTLTARNP